jgi:uncharacterized phage-associated protein
MFEESPSPMKLQKLCYYAQAVHMATNNAKELFSEDFEAWTYGPVVKDLYTKYKGYNWRPIAEELEIPALPQEITDSIELAVATYGKFDGAALSTMTHREAPWISARGNIADTEGSNAVITKKSIFEYFSREFAS